MQPKITTSHAEIRLRGILAKVLPGSVPTYNHRPKWLRGCELDIHFQKEKIAFEFDGKQHREFTPEFHRTRADFERQLERDGFKRVQCALRGIVVVTVAFEHLSEENVRALLVDALAIRAGLEPEEPSQSVPNYYRRKGQGSQRPPKSRKERRTQPRKKFQVPQAKADPERDAWIAGKIAWVNGVR